ncbi:hypothetical protein O7047_00730 [Pseudenterobacter timonensis]|uniref:Uncharacterized protein n=2 Tax=Pseudenterobacter timonensis TaxID=1755099 RepID=A0AAE4DJU3_9ENTR|nr:hypothetical protein [Pseudenterobacter timonensis]
MKPVSAETFQEVLRVLLKLARKVVFLPSEFRSAAHFSSAIACFAEAADACAGLLQHRSAHFYF